jgi:hypothetical protein
MSKRNLRVLKWIGTTPAIGICTSCDRQFTVPVTALKRVAEAQQSLSLQFAQHDCVARANEESAAQRKEERGS